MSRSFQRHFMLPAFAALACLIVSCDSLEGPQGEQGPPGVANIQTVIRSYSADDVSINGGTGGVRFPMGEITQQVYNGGDVRVYYKNSDYWLALPWSYAFDYSDDLEVDETVEFTYAYETGNLYLFFISSDNFLSRNAIFSGQIKVVIVPPSVVEEEAGPSARMQGHDVRNHAGILDHLNLREQETQAAPRGRLDPFGPPRRP